MENWLQWSQLLANYANVLVAIGGILAAFAALVTYRQNANLEKAKWLASLYEKFYERDQLKAIRDALDCDDDISLDFARLIREESSDFTDYLNFFEFVAFLRKSKQLEYTEVEQIFGYYLSCLHRRRDVREYINKRGYELLSELIMEFGKTR